MKLQIVTYWPLVISSKNRNCYKLFLKIYLLITVPISRIVVFQLAEKQVFAILVIIKIFIKKVNSLFISIHNLMLGGMDTFRTTATFRIQTAIFCSDFSWRENRIIIIRHLLFIELYIFFYYFRQRIIILTRFDDLM